MINLETKLTPKAVNCILFLVYLFSVGIIAIHHEPWRDELNAWLIARDSAFTEIRDILRHGGTPGLWYIILRPFARSGFPTETIQILNLIFVNAGILVLLFCSPFSWTLKLLFIASPFLAYEYPIVARSYGLSICFLFFVAWLFCKPQKSIYLILILLFLALQTNAHGFILANAMFFSLIYTLKPTPKKRLIAIAVFLIGASFAIYQVIPPEDPQILSSPYDYPFFLAPWIYLGWGLIPIFTNCQISAAIVGVSSFIFFVILFYQNKEALIFYIASHLGLWFLFIFVYPPAPGHRHVGFFLISTIIALWIWLSRINHNNVAINSLRFRKKTAIILISLVILPGTLETKKLWQLEISKHYSNAKEMARFIKENDILNSSDIAAHPILQSGGIIAFLPRGSKFWFPALGEWGSYMKWNKRWSLADSLPCEEAVSLLESDLISSRTKFFLLINKPLPVSRYKLIFSTEQTPSIHKDENFYLYSP